MKHGFGKLILGMTIVLTVGAAYGADPIGIFEDNVDVGTPNVPGAAKLSTGQHSP